MADREARPTTNERPCSTTHPAIVPARGRVSPSKNWMPPFPWAAQTVNADGSLPGKRRITRPTGITRWSASATAVNSALRSR